MLRYILMIMLSFSLVACGGGGDEPADKSDMKDDKRSEQKSPAAEKDDMADTKQTAKEVSLKLYTVGETMTTMAYEPAQLEVPAGAKVTLSLQNNAKSEAMIHNAVIIKAGKQSAVTELGMAAGPEKDYIPESDDIIAATKLVKPGESTEITFEAPLKKGTYQYICTYPGHTAMKGVLLVR